MGAGGACDASVNADVTVHEASDFLFARSLATAKDDVHDRPASRTPDSTLAQQTSEGAVHPGTVTAMTAKRSPMLRRYRWSSDPADDYYEDYVRARHTAKERKALEPATAHRGPGSLREETTCDDFGVALNAEPLRYLMHSEQPSMKTIRKQSSAGSTAMSSRDSGHAHDFRQTISSFLKTSALVRKGEEIGSGPRQSYDEGASASPLNGRSAGAVAGGLVPRQQQGASHSLQNPTMKPLCALSPRSIAERGSQTAMNDLLANRKLMQARTQLQGTPPASRSDNVDEQDEAGRESSYLSLVQAAPKAHREGKGGWATRFSTNGTGGGGEVRDDAGEARTGKEAKGFGMSVPWRHTIRRRTQPAPQRSPEELGAAWQLVVKVRVVLLW